MGKRLAASSLATFRVWLCAFSQPYYHTMRQRKDRPHLLNLVLVLVLVI